jgi:hypothetical protein
VGRVRQCGVDDLVHVDAAGGEELRILTTKDSVPENASGHFQTPCDRWANAGRVVASRENGRVEVASGGVTAESR